MENEVKKMLKPYNAVIAYETPIQGFVTVAAESLEHAKEILLDAMRNNRNPRVVNIYALEDCPELAKEFEASQEETVN